MAFELCKQNGLFFVKVSDGYVVYRKGTERGNGVRLGRRRDAGSLLSFVRKLTQGASDARA